MDCGEKAVGAVSGLAKVAVYFVFEMISSRARRARVSPPRCWLVAGLRPSSESVGTAKSPFGPARWVYDVSFSSRCMLLKSGLGEGWVCSNSRDKVPGSGRDFGASIGFTTSPSFSAA